MEAGGTTNSMDGAVDEGRSSVRVEGSNVGVTISPFCYSQPSAVAYEEAEFCEVSVIPL